MLEKALEFSHSLLRKTISPGDWLIDATVGNGNDTVFLAALAGKTGKVLGFDIQASALEKTKEKLLLTGLQQQVELFHMGHENAADLLKEDQRLGGVIFNLGYLPGGDKNITTQKETTIKSVSSLLPFLRIGSLLVLVVYSGHTQGADEKDALMEYVKELDQQRYSVLLYQFLNQKNNPPFVIAIERRKS